MRTLQNRMPEMIKELVELANSSSMYERYACNYIENLTDVNYSVFKRSFKKANKNGELTQSKYCNTLVKGKLNKSLSIM